MRKSEIINCYNYLLFKNGTYSGYRRVRKLALKKVRDGERERHTNRQAHARQRARGERKTEINRQRQRVRERLMDTEIEKVRKTVRQT